MFSFASPFDFYDPNFLIHAVADLAHLTLTPLAFVGSLWKESPKGGGARWNGHKSATDPSSYIQTSRGIAISNIFFLNRLLHFRVY